MGSAPATAYRSYTAWRIENKPLHCNKIVLYLILNKQEPKMKEKDKVDELAEHVREIEMLVINMGKALITLTVAQDILDEDMVRMADSLGEKNNQLVSKLLQKGLLSDEADEADDVDEVDFIGSSFTSEQITEYLEILKDRANNECDSRKVLFVDEEAGDEDIISFDQFMSEIVRPSIRE